jgi:SAM-dependent methyltransferase
MKDEDIKIYLDGTRLLGDDYSIEEIREWYDEEKEAYADLGSKNDDNYVYNYHNLNKVHGFNKLPAKKHYKRVLGIGSAYGLEFKPIKNQIGDLDIVEPSDNLISEEIFGLRPTYVKPLETGELPFPDNHFDLITSFGSLHHIPNVSFVLKEINRVLKPGGYYLLREPIVSMGDWREARVGLTKRERGIPVNIFESIIDELDLEVVNKAYCICMTNFIQSKIGKFFPSRIISYKAYVMVDKWLGKLLQKNISYHHERFIKKIAPQAVFYVLNKKVVKF